MASAADQRLPRLAVGVARLALEGAEGLGEALLRVDRLDREQPIEELGNLGRARAWDDLLAEDRERVEGVLVEEDERGRGTGAGGSAPGFAVAGAGA